MAETAVAAEEFDLAATTEDPTPVTIVHANTHRLTLAGPLEEHIIRVTHTTHAAKTLTIVAGDQPPCGGLDDLTVDLDDATAADIVYWLAGLESARFVQSDGTVEITVAASTTGDITLFHVPRRF